MAYPDNPAYECVIHPVYVPIFEKHVNKTPSFGVRIKPHLDSFDLDAKSVAPVVVSDCPPWKLFKPNFIFDLRSHKKIRYKPSSDTTKLC